MMAKNEKPPTRWASVAREYSSHVPVSAFGLDDRSEWRVCLDRDRRGDMVIDIRVYEEIGGPAKVRSGSKRGVSIGVDKIHDLLHAVTKAIVVLAEIQPAQGGG